MTDQKSNSETPVADSQPTLTAEIDARPAAPAFPVVGLVGAAGSRQALESFFRHLPEDGGMAFVVVTRLAAKQNQQLLSAITARTDMPVLVAADGAAIQTDHIYVAPAGVQLTLAKGLFHLQNLTRENNQGPLDAFLLSLAADQGNNAVAILLSGAGEDGIRGLQQVKAQGGLLLVQEPDDAAHAALPRRGVALGADRVGAVGELAQHLVQTKGDLANVPLATTQGQEESFNQLFTAILYEIATQTGHDLSHYKSSTLQRRMLRRMGMAGISSLAQYLELLQNRPAETVALFRDCLVSVTSFFRDPDAYEMLERDCVPQLFLKKGRSDFVRVWVAGCATGEEAYSVAIQLAERAAQVNEPPRLQLFATDIDEEAIAVARRGLYPAAIAKDMAPNRLQRYFVEENGWYRVKTEIREHVLFAVHDLLKDPPFSRLDLVCCRNVLIYFNREAQEKVFTIFHYALNPNGYLFLGTSESVDAANDLFAVLNKHCHLYQRRDVLVTPQRRPLGATATASLAALGGKMNARVPQRQTDKPRTVEEMYTAWSLRVHTPPRLLVNDNYDITHLFGGAERYLQERDGAITQNILQKILPDLRLDLRTALYQAFNKGERTISRLLRVEIAQQTQMVQLHVGPVAEPGFPQEYVEVVFTVHDDATLLGLPAPDDALEADLSLVARMEEELLRTRERLQTIIEEYEISGQELKASNEELQSINEELKSTTEELETSKEELQSMNEELTTVNSELTRKIDELHRANSDLLNLIASTDVGAIFLNRALQIKRFTPRATDLFNLIEGDIGRPFTHVTHRLRHTELPALAAHVNATSERIEETVQRNDERWFMLRLFPYRTVLGEIDGVVITFVDINDLKRAESEERQRRQQQSLAELSRQALTGSDLDTLLTATAHRVTEVLDMELCKVIELQPDGKTLLLKAGVGWREGLVGRATLPADTTSQAGYTLQAHAPIIVRDLQTETRFRAPTLLTEHEVRSGIGVTIPSQGASDREDALSVSEGAYGVLSVHSRQPRAFATYDVDYLQAVANLLAAAIARRRAETALRAEEQRYRSIFESVGVSIWEEDFTAVRALMNQIAGQDVADLRTYLITHPTVVAQAIALVRIHNVNHYSLTLFGAETKEQLLNSLDRIFTPETTDVFLEEMVTLAEGRQYYAAETTLQTLQGEKRHVFFTITFPHFANDLERVVVSMLDITERKEAEATLQRYADMLRLSHDAILVWSLERGIEFWNEGAETLYGYSAAEALGRLSHELLATVHPQPVAEFWAELRRVGSLESELVHTTKTGAKVVVSTRHQIVEDADGDTLVLEINRDITAQKQVEADLRASEERYRYLFETMDEGFCVIEMIFDENGAPQDYRFLEANPAFARFTGLEGAVGRTARELVPQLEAHWFEIYGTIARTGEPHRFEQRSVAMGRWFDVYAFRVGGEESRRVAILFNNITKRKEAEAILARYQLLSEQARDIILFIRLDGQIVEANTAAVEAYGYARETLLGMKIHDLRAPETRSQVAAQMVQADRGSEERGLRFETVHRRQDGGVFPVEVSSIGADVGGERLLLSVIRDISERKATEAALAASEAKFATAFSLSPLILTITSLTDGRLIEVNESFEHTTGYTRTEALGRTPDELQLWANPQQRTHGLARLAAGETIENIEAIFRMKNGEHRTCLLGGTIVNIDGQPCALTALTDITERKAAEAALRQSEERFVTFFRRSPYPIAILSLADGCYVDVNPTWERDTGYTRAEVVGRTPAELGLQAEPPLHLRKQLQEQGAIRDIEINVQMRNGQRRTALMSAERIQLHDEDHAMLVFTDITERKQAEERLRFLAEASTMLASSLDYSVTLENVAHAAIPGIADWCVIDLVEEEGSFQTPSAPARGGAYLPSMIAHADPSKIRWAYELRERYPIDPNAPAGAPHVIRTGESEFYPEITDAMLQAVAKNAEELQLLHSVGYRSIMIVPLKTHGRILGAITFVATENERHFTADDLLMAQELAQRAAAAIGNAQLHQAVRQREGALRISEERLRLATEAGKIGIYDHDLLTNQTTYSAIYRSITGVEPDEKLTRAAWLERVYPADRALVTEKLERAVAHGESYDYEYRIYRPDGELRWLGVNSRATVDETGRTIRLTGAVSDITERKGAEEEIQRLNRDLRRRLDELQTLLDVAPIGIFVAHDPACTVITSNMVGAQMLGLQPGANASKSAPTGDALPFRVLRDGREVTPDELPMQYAVSHDTPVYNWEGDVVRTDGRVVNLYEYAIPLHDEEGKVRGCLGVFVDITERKGVEASLRESEERFRSAFEQAAVGMAHLSIDGRYLRVNDRLCEILGYTRAELLQKSFMEVTHPADLASDLTQMERQLAGEIVHHSMEKRYLRKDGSFLWANMTASVVRDDTGAAKYGIVVIEDIAARKAAEEELYQLNATLNQRVAERTAELERSNLELDQFAYVASHDLKSPLRAIVNLAGWIAEDAGAYLPPPSLEHLQKLQGRALRMERLLDDLLTYSRIGRRDGVVEEVKTEALIQDAIYLLAPPTGFAVKVIGGLPVLRTPRTPLELVFRNLISNAIKHHNQPEQGVVRIHAEDLGDFFEFSISDNGPGIDPQYHERIFGMFQTLRPRDEVEGSGMGLAIAKRAIEYRGGAIGVESTLGEGTTFRFTWPKQVVIEAGEIERVNDIG